MKKVAESIANVNRSAGEELGLSPKEAGPKQSEVSALMPVPAMPSIAQMLDIQSLRVAQDFNELVNATETLVAVTVGKPPKQEFVRVSPDSAHCLSTYTLKVKGEREEVYLVDRPVWGALSEELTHMLIVLAVTNTRAPFLWPLRVPSADGRTDNWAKSAMAAANVAKEKWVRVTADVSRGCYRVLSAQDDLGEPVWPKESFDNLVQLAFGDRFIRTTDDPVVRRLRGAR